MKVMVRTLGALALFAALAAGSAACGKHEAILKAEAMADAVCKCKDFECALKARIDGTAKLVKHKDDLGSEDEAKQVAAALARSQSCQQKLQTTAASATDAAPATAPPATPAPAGESR